MIKILSMRITTAILRQGIPGIAILHLLIGSATVSLAETPASNGRVRRDLFRMNLPRMGKPWPCQPGSLWINAQASHKFIIFPEFGSRKGAPPIHLSADYSFDQHWSAGIYYGFYNGRYTDLYGNEPYESQIRAYLGGLRLSLHFADIFNNAFGEVVNVRKWDFYATTHVGWYTFRWDVNQIHREQQDFSEGSFGSLGLVLGARWIPVPKLAVFIEGGKGPVGWLSFGISGKLMK